MAYATMEDGKRVWYETVGNGQPVVLIGGSSIAHRQWDFMVPILRDHYRLVLFDQRGAGKSDRNPVGISAERWVDDLKEILDMIGIEKCHVLSTSNGSLVAIRFAAKYPERTAAIVHYGIYKFTDQYRKMSTVGATIINEFGIGNGSLGAYFLTRMFGTPAICEDWVANRFEENLSPKAWKAMHEALDVDFTAELDKIAAPQMVMLGESGPLGNSTDYSSGAHFLQERFADIEVRTIPDTNGTFHVFTRPFECAEAVINFFSKHTAVL
jgi:pimeloyl-ACP methyl ester carboxylesterase